MRIRLFKNCILNDSYSEVFDCTHSAIGTSLNYHEKYLDKIATDYGYRDFDIDTTYLTLSGVLSFDVTYDYLDYDEFSKFNYMRIEDDATLITKYYFIEHIEIVNGCCIINYKEDIWSNYSAKMNLRMGILTRSKLINYNLKDNKIFNIPFFKLGLNYESNNILELNHCFDDTNKNINIIIKYQIYKPSKEGSTTIRETRIGLLEYLKIGNKEIKPTYKFNINNAIKNINNILLNSSTSDIMSTNRPPLSLPGKFNYDVLDIYVLPDNINFISENNTAEDLNNINFADTLGEPYQDVVLGIRSLDDLIIGLNITNNDMTLVNKYNIINNFKNYSFGLLSDPLPIDSNGSDIEVKINTYLNGINFKILLEFQNKIIDITNDFEVEFPVSVTSADVTQLKQISRTVRNESLNNQRNLQAFQIAKDSVSALMSLGSVARNSVAFDKDGMMEASRSAFNKGIDISAGVVGLNEIENQRNLVNANAHVSNKPVAISNEEAILNALNSFILFKIQPDNEQEVQLYYNETGAVVNEVITFDIIKNFDPKFYQDNIKFNIMKFDYVRINGEFPQDIMRALKSILTNGFKIWYNYEL